MLSTYSDLYLDYIQIYELFWNTPFKMVEIMAIMIIFDTGFIHDRRRNIPCQYLIGGLTTYGELIWVTHKNMIFLGSLLYTQ